MATDDIAKVETVAAGSPAAKANIQAGDTLVALNQQPLISIADVSWILHRSPDSGSLAATVQRSGKESTVEINLPAGWRLSSDISKRVGTWPMRAMAFGGMFMEDLDDAARAEAKLPTDSMALRIKHVGEFGEHAAAKKAGFKAGDILVQVGDLKQRISESALIGTLLQNHRPGEKLAATIVRGTDRMELKLPQQ